MPKPVILSLDDEVHVSNAIAHDLRQRYSRDYRIIATQSPSVALDTVHQLKRRDDQVALFLVDQRMPDMEGTEFLGEAARLYPDAGKILLTAYADTEAAIRSINEIGLDHYLMKPWDPPDLNLYPVLDDLLSEWRANAPTRYDGIRVAGTRWSPHSHAVKDFLSRNRLPYQWLDVEANAEAGVMVEEAGKTDRRLPVVFFPDGSFLIQPDNRALAEKVGLQTHATRGYYDLIIVGAGPAGLGAAVYGASEGLATALVERAATGGQAGTSSRIENYLGFPKGISGSDLARRATDQARRLGAEILTTAEVTGVRVEDPFRIVTLDDGAELSCKALIIATGVTLRRLDAPGVERLTGAGIYYGAASTEAAACHNENVIVVGGANSAGQAAMFLSSRARQVIMLVRGESLRRTMSTYLIDQIAATPTIDVQANTVVLEALGEDRVSAVRVRNTVTGEERELPTSVVFIFIGAVPHSHLVAGVVERDPTGFIRTGRSLLRDMPRSRIWPLPRDPLPLETNVPGIFVAGDVRADAMRRVAFAVGDGAHAVSQVHQYLETV